MLLEQLNELINFGFVGKVNFEGYPLTAGVEHNFNGLPIFSLPFKIRDAPEGTVPYWESVLLLRQRISRIRKDEKNRPNRAVQVRLSSIFRGLSRYI